LSVNPPIEKDYEEVGAVAEGEGEDDSEEY
jgi:hypothetical protein